MEMAFKPQQTCLNAAWVNKIPALTDEKFRTIFLTIFFHFYFDTAEDEPNLNLQSYIWNRKGHVLEFFWFPLQVLKLKVTREISVILAFSL